MANASEKVMTRVMNLLNLANDENATPAERALAEEHAERLMAQHMIDRMDLKAEEKSRVIKDEWEFRASEVDYEYQGLIFALLSAVLKHCGVRPNPRKKYGKLENGRTDYSVNIVEVVGFPEDMAYAERIWFNVFRTFVSNINPKWDTSETLGQNIYRFIKSGYSWQQVHDFAYAAREDHYGLPERGKGGGSKLHRAYKEELERLGEEWAVTRRNKAYRASFARSFTETIGNRLYQIRSAAKQTVSDGDKFALAVRDTKEQVDAEFYLLYPEYDPENIRKRHEEEDFLRACAFAALSPEEQRQVLKEEAEEERRWRAKMARTRGNYNRVRASDRTDASAWERGHKVANTVNLRADAEVKKTKMGELG